MTIQTIFVLPKRKFPIYIYYWLKADSSGNIIESFDLGPPSFPSRQWAIMGNQKRISEFLKGNPEFWWSKPPQQVIRELITLEIEANPKEVNFPIKIFSFSQKEIKRYIYFD
ncbi:hypothetical protein JW935_13665 [candidate division KSB1 bacterium]|nr:hypothetical protein [candidate division KSB1 bacterium]